jgi:transcriptional regulator with XRE-family HTH domain
MGQGPRAKPKRLAEKLLQIREGLGLSQNGIARRMGLADELSQSNISEFESGRREPSLLVLLQYARTAGVTIDMLADDEVDLPGTLTAKPGKGSSAQKPRRK